MHGPLFGLKKFLFCVALCLWVNEIRYICTQGHWRRLKVIGNLILKILQIVRQNCWLGENLIQMLFVPELILKRKCMKLQSCFMRKLIVFFWKKTVIKLLKQLRILFFRMKNIFLVELLAQHVLHICTADVVIECFPQQNLTDVLLAASTIRNCWKLSGVLTSLFEIFALNAFNVLSKSLHDCCWITGFKFLLLFLAISSFWVSW